MESFAIRFNRTADRMAERDARHMLDQQDGKCAACGSGQRLLHADHDPETGRIRGWLCQPCYVTAGHIESDRFSGVMRFIGRDDLA